MCVRESMVCDLNFYDLAFGSGGTVQFSAVTDDPPEHGDMMNRLGEAPLIGASLRDVTWRRTPGQDRFVA